MIRLWSYMYSSVAAQLSTLNGPLRGRRHSSHSLSCVCVCFYVFVCGRGPVWANVKCCQEELNEAQRVKRLRLG